MIGTSCHVYSAKNWHIAGKAKYFEPGPTHNWSGIFIAIIKRVVNETEVSKVKHIANKGEISQLLPRYYNFTLLSLTRKLLSVYICGKSINFVYYDWLRALTYIGF